MKIGRVLQYAVIYFFLILVVFVVLYPVAFTFSGAFSKTNSLTSLSLVPIPSDPSLVQFERLFSKTRYVMWYRNTLIVAVMNTVLSLVVTVTAAYILSRFRFKGKKILMSSFLVFQILPSFVSLVAIYVILWRLGSLNSLWGLVLVYAAGSIPYNTWLIKGYFDTIPKSIDEAARVDGASHMMTYTRIILPNAAPMVSFLAITSFTGPWMDFIFPRLVLRSDENKTLAVGLFELINGRSNDNYTMFAAGALLVAVPFIILFVLGQRYMISTLAAGAVKG